MLQAILIVVAVLVVLIAGLFLVAAMKPDTFRIERSAVMKAPPDKVFALINDFHEWGSWSPWEKLDPNLQRSYSGAANGKGAVYEWEGNKQVGKGRMEIMESTPPTRVGIQLDFLKPFEAHHTAEFRIEPQGDTTQVTWAMHGRQPFFFKVMSMFMSMDKMVGKDFEKGLANMKQAVEV